MSLGVFASSNFDKRYRNWMFSLMLVLDLLKHHFASSVHSTE
ncbi:hypothetical protein BVRB_8g183190 [Beta vulgaris subsp. vulgaris]|nr:hypothetical protein BVRB_8g183190 [Beta vulgaris subsp. vulgaris]